MSEELPRERLKAARIRSGYRSAAEAARANGWAVPTYCGHENGGRNFDADWAKKYGAAFTTDPAWLLLGNESGARGAQEMAPARTARFSRTPGDALTLTSLPNGKARLEVNKVMPMALALKLLTMIEEGGE